MMSTDKNTVFEVPPTLRRTWHRVLRHTAETLLRERKIKLRPPEVQVDAEMKPWGAWEPVTRTVTLSQRLILHCSWDSVLETLKHELAHMLVDEYFRVPGAAPHGEEFKRACRMLGVSAKASASDVEMGISLDEREGETIPQNPFLDKVKKLLALSASSSENEAREAMRKANEILLKYNVTMPVHEESFCLDHDYRRIGGLVSRRSLEDVKICNILKEFFFVEYLLTSSYDAQNNRNQSGIEIMGRTENLEMAEYVFHFLKAQCGLLWEQARKRWNLKGMRDKKSYVLGLLDGFRKTLETQREISQKNELIWLGEKSLLEYFSYRHPRIRRITRGGRLMTMGSYKQGTEDGKRVVIHRPVEHRGNGLHGLLSR